MYISKQDAKLYLLVGYLTFSFVYIFIRLIMFYSYFSAEPLLFIYQMVTIFLAAASLVCWFIREKFFWYLIFYAIVLLPLTYCAGYLKVAAATVGAGSSLGELLSINYVTLLYTVAGLGFALFLFDGDILERFKVDRVNWVALLIPTLLIAVYNLVIV